jgi:hypothetical protein
MAGVACIAAFLAAAQALGMPEIAAGRRLLSARRGVR